MFVLTGNYLIILLYYPLTMLTLSRPSVSCILLLLEVLHVLDVLLILLLPQFSFRSSCPCPIPITVLLQWLHILQLLFSRIVILELDPFSLPTLLSFFIFAGSSFTSARHVHVKTHKHHPHHHFSYK